MLDRTWFKPNIVASDFEQQELFEVQLFRELRYLQPRHVEGEHVVHGPDALGRRHGLRADIDLNVHLFGPVEPCGWDWWGVPV